LRAGDRPCGLEHLKEKRIGTDGHARRKKKSDQSLRPPREREELLLRGKAPARGKIPG